MGLSTYTAKRFFDDARRDTGVGVNTALYVNRFNLINSSVDAVFELLNGLMVPSFMKAISLQSKVRGNKLSAGTADYVPVTGILTATMVRQFAASDVEKEIVLSLGTKIYRAMIDTYINGTMVTVRGNLLPTVNTSFDDARVPDNGSDSIQVGGLRINRTIAQIHMNLDSSVTNYTKSVSLDDLRVFDASAPENSDKIVFALEGQTLRLKKGNTLPIFGDMTLHAPMMPTPVSSDDMTVDLPDGPAIQIAIAVCRNHIYRRLGRDIPDSNAILPMVQGVYAAANQEVSSEELAAKVRAMI